MDVQAELKALERQLQERLDAARAARPAETRTEREIVQEAIEAYHAVAATHTETDPMERMAAIVRVGEAELALRPILERAGADEARPMEWRSRTIAGRWCAFWIGDDGLVHGRPGTGDGTTWDEAGVLGRDIYGAVMDAAG